MKIKAMAILLLVCGAAMAAESKYILTSKRLSSTEVGLTCLNGADPTGRKIGNTLIISCGQ